MSQFVKYTFGILLPIKIEGQDATPSQLQYLSSLADSVACKHGCVIHLGIDLDKAATTALSDFQLIFKKRDIPVQVTLFGEDHKGNICHYWRILAKNAVEAACDFFCLLGDDVEMHSSMWMECIVDDFKVLHADLKLPDDLFGFGCIAMTDLQAPGFPTFPVLHRLHLQLNQELFSDKFVNQDADPFLFQLYRRFGAARFSKDAKLTNHVGGVQLLEDTSYEPPRYEREHIDWSNDLLSEAVQRISDAIDLPEANFTTVDVIVPTFRVDRTFLERICNLKSSVSNVDVCFIVVVDNPDADVAWLKVLANARSDLRVRVDPTNQGASFTRNVGMDESAAEFILFLDDDVIPDPHIIDRYVEALRAEGAAYDGFVGYSELPDVPDQMLPTAVHFSGVSFFWRAARKMKEMPWGITANLFVRRAACPRFDLGYIKTGGGEDIDFYLKLSRQPLLAVPKASVLHPWWDNGQRCYKHFFNWSQSDGMLQDVYPHLTYRCCPDAMESSFLAVGIAVACQQRCWVLLPLTILAADAVMDQFAHWRNDNAEPYSTGGIRVLAILESTLIKNTSCVGRLWGHWKRGSLLNNFCKRFDWSCGLDGAVVVGEQSRALWRFVGFSVAVVATVLVSGIV